MKQDSSEDLSRLPPYYLHYQTSPPSTPAIMSPRYGSGLNPQDAIVLGDNDDVNDTDEEAVILEDRIRNFRPPTNRHDQMVKREIRVKDEESNNAFNLEMKYEEEALVIINNFVDLTADDNDEPPVQGPYQQLRWSPSPPPSVPGIIEIDSDTLHAPHLGADIKVKSCYEIVPVERHQKVQFILVTGFRKYQRDEAPVVIGRPYARCRSLHGLLPRKLNEIVAVYEVVDIDPRSMEEQALIEVPLADIISHRHMHVTNAEFPEHVGDSRQYFTKDEALAKGPLICRWKYIIHFHTLVSRAEGKPCEWELRRISADEVSKARFKVDEDVLRHSWRGPTYRGGTHNCRGLRIADEALPTERAPGQKYSFFDAFCGAGGASRGAERAGFEIKHGVDSWSKACQSWRMNFTHAHCHEMDVFDFIQTTADEEIRVDALHLSPPCQVWSPAHTIAGQNDEANVMALFACRSLIDKVRPRVVTLEQTFGILKPSFKKFFDALVLGFTDYGYSICWKVVNCANYGLPQRRNRLVMIASCPGERFPGFPPPTHSATGGNNLKKYTSIRLALSKITPHLAESDPHHQPKEKPAPADAVIGDPDSILPRCMTTSGGQNYHYNGQRCYTNREFACLQGFPSWHKFSASYVKKQVGNAFPPVVVQVLYEHLQKSMHARDGFDGDSRPKVAIAEKAIRLDENDNGGSSGGDRDDVVMMDAPPPWARRQRRLGLGYNQPIILD